MFGALLANARPKMLSHKWLSSKLDFVLREDELDVGLAALQ